MKVNKDLWLITAPTKAPGLATLTQTRLALAGQILILSVEQKDIVRILVPLYMRDIAIQASTHGQEKSLRCFRLGYRHHRARLFVIITIH